jgi:hypothetical protein
MKELLELLSLYQLDLYTLMEIDQQDILKPLLPQVQS